MFDAEDSDDAPVMFDDSVRLVTGSILMILSLVTVFTNQLRMLVIRVMWFWFKYSLFLSALIFWNSQIIYLNEIFNFVFAMSVTDQNILWRLYFDWPHVVIWSFIKVVLPVQVWVMIRIIRYWCAGIFRKDLSKAKYFLNNAVVFVQRSWYIL